MIVLGDVGARSRPVCGLGCQRDYERRWDAQRTTSGAVPQNDHPPPEAGRPANDRPWDPDSGRRRIVGLVRRLLLAIVRRLAEALVRLYYPKRVVEGGERIPTGKPLVFLVNHPNGLLDPLVLRVSTGRAARFLAKSTLFGNPFGRLAMDAFGSIPIYRAQEAGGRAGDASRNDESFARCRAELATGGALALFPEGTSHSDPQLRPLKTGAARIALSAEAEQTGGSGSCSCRWVCITRASRPSGPPCCCRSASRSRWRRSWRTTGATSVPP